MTPVVFANRHKLTATQALVLDFLDRNTSRRYAYSLFSVNKIASAVGCCRRSVELALDAFREHNLVEVVKGPALRSLRALHGWRRSIRAAFRLLWRPAGAAPTAPHECAKIARREPDIFAPPGPAIFARSIEPPPDPPNRKETEKDQRLVFVNNGSLKERLLAAGVPEAAMRARPEPAPVAEAVALVEETTTTFQASQPEPEPEPEPARRHEPEPTPEAAPDSPPKATAEQVAAVVARAERAMPGVPEVAAKVREAAVAPRRDGRPLGLEAVGWIVDRVAAKASRDPAGYFFTLVADWRANGPRGPVRAPRPPAQQNLNRHQAAPPDESPPTPEEVESLRKLAAGPEHLAVTRVARRTLAAIAAGAG